MTSEESANRDAASSPDKDFEAENIFLLGSEFPPEGNGAGSRGILAQDDTEEELEYLKEEEREGEGGEVVVVPKKDREPQLLGLATATRRRGKREGDGDSCDSPSPLGLPGTTPPAGSRYMKHARKTHKYRGGKKLSLGHIPKLRYRDTLQKRPCSMITLPATADDEDGEGEGGRGRRNTVPRLGVRRSRKEGQRQRRVGEAKGGKRKYGGSSGGHQSPHQAGGDEKNLQKKKKKQSQRKITLDRDEKIAQNPSSPLPPPMPPSPKKSTHWRHPLVPVQSVDLPDYTPSLHLTVGSPNDPLTTSLQMNFLLPPYRSASASMNEDAKPAMSGRVYRSYSDAHVSLPPVMFFTGHEQLQRLSVRCPPDRKQFFRRFQKALKYAAGISRPQPQPPETPYHPHMTRYHSENLGLENPRGDKCVPISAHSILYCL